MSQVNWIRQLFLAITLFVLGLTAYWWEFKKKPEREEKEEQTKRVFSLKETPIKSIQLTHGLKAAGKQENVSFQCLDLDTKLCKSTDQSKWQLKDPVQLRADDTAVNTFLTTLERLSTSDVIDLKEEPEDKRKTLLKEYGLDPESRSKTNALTLITEKGEATLYLGLAHPIHDSVFAVKQSAADSKPESSITEVLLVPNHLKSYFEHDLTYWRDKKLSTFAAQEVRTFEIQSGQTRFTADREQGEWMIHSPQGDLPGDSESIDQYLGFITQLSAKNFAVEKKTSPQGIAFLKNLKLLTQVTLYKSAEKDMKEKPQDQKSAATPITFALYTAPSTQGDGKVYATTSNLDPIFELDPASKGRLDKKPEDLRMTRLISMMERFAAKRLEFLGPPVGGSPLILVQKDGKWSREDGKDSLAEEKVQELLEKLSGSRIKGFLKDKAIPSGEGEGIILVLGDEKSTNIRRYAFWKKGDLLFGRDLKANRKEAFSLDAALLNALPWKPDFFKANPTQEKQETPEKSVHQDHHK